MLALLSLTCLTLAPLTAQAAPATDPRNGVVELPAAEGWRASLVLDRGEVGIWTVKSFQVFPGYGTPEVVGLDDKGRCWILVHYSGKWTPLSTIEEGEWLGGLDHGDVDPRAPGAELYTGGKKGNLYQVRAYPFGATDHRLIARFPGEEVHTLLAGDFDPRVAGSELLVFTSPGALYRVTPSGPHGEFEATKLCDTPGRVRDALVLPQRDGEATARIATVSRSGELALLNIGPDGPVWSVVHAVPVGRGRLSLAPARAGRGNVLYTSQDDGVILRHEELAGAASPAWRSEVIFRGPLGPRGVKAGTFDADPMREQVLVFGYSGAVQMLTRGEGDWRAETIFVDRAGGHWLDTIEIDSRNATDEILGSGYGGRIVMLARPPGYGQPGGAAMGGEPGPLRQGADTGLRRVDAAPEPLRGVAPASRSSGDADTVRALFVAGTTGAQRLDPLRYRGGFQAKTAGHETLVRRDEAGHIAPGLAAQWASSADGRELTLTLRPHACWHSGAPVAAADVVAHFERVIGHPEHAWLRGIERVTEVSAPSPRTVRFVLREPWDLLSDLCAINPCAVRGPGTLDGEGEYTRPVGSGPWAFREADGARLVFDEHTPPGGARPRRLELTSIGPQRVLGVETNAALAKLRGGEIDVLADGWDELVPRASFAAAAANADVAVATPGSSVWYMSFSLTGPTAPRALRRALAAAIDRAALARDVEQGFADPCAGWAAATVSAWPAPLAPPALPAEEVAAADAARDVTLRFVAADGEREAALARALTAQLVAGGFDIALEVLSGADASARIEAGAFDLRLERTWGVPYDPDLSLQARFLPPPEAPSAARVRDHGVDPALRALVSRYAAATDEARRSGLATQIQRHLERDASVVPLYAPQRLALARAGVPRPALGLDLYRTGW